MRKLLKVAFSIAIALTLTACAGSVSAPVPVRALSQQQASALRISQITGEAAQGVEMAPADFDRITAKVRGYISNQAPGVIVDQNSAAGMQAVTMKIVFTRYDAGSATARFLLAGLGQIRIDAQVMLLDRGGSTIGQYQVSKQFALGGVAGATTSMADVEDGFEKSVAEIVKSKMM